MDLVIPLAVELIANDGQFRHVLIWDLYARSIERIVNLSLDCQPFLSACVGNEVDDHGSAFQGSTAPVLTDMAEHPMFDLVPFAGARREMTDMNGHIELLSQLLDFDFPEAHATAIAAAAIGGDQQFHGLGVESYSHPLPPAANSRHGKLCGIMVNPDTYPPLIVRQVVNTIRDNFSEFFVTLSQSVVFVLTLSLTDYWQIILGLLIGGGIAAPLAARMTKNLPLKALMIMVGVLIILLSIRTILLALN